MSQRDRIAYCRQQAAECARSALAATLAEAREAYANLEQGWLQLIPEAKDGQDERSRAGGAADIPRRGDGVRHKRRGTTRPADDS